MMCVWDVGFLGAGYRGAFGGEGMDGMEGITLSMGGEISDRTEIGAVTIAPGGEHSRVCASSLFLHP